MRIVAKIPYSAISPEEIAELDKLQNQGFAVQIVLDPVTEEIFLMV